MFGSYTMIGKLMAQGTFSKEATWFFLVCSFLVSIVYLDPLTQLRKFIRRWFTSDTVAFSVFVMLAATISVLMNWFRIFLPVMLILMTEGLARLDLQASGYSKWKTFLLLVLTTGLGLLCGWWLDQ